MSTGNTPIKYYHLSNADVVSVLRLHTFNKTTTGGEYLIIDYITKGQTNVILFI